MDDMRYRHLTRLVSFGDQEKINSTLIMKLFIIELITTSKARDHGKVTSIAYSIFT